MSLNRDQKAGAAAKLKRHDRDTGSPEVQVALLSANIEQLSGHFTAHPKDRHSRVGLVKMVNSRRRLLDHLKTTDVDRYKSVVAQLGLRK